MSIGEAITELKDQAVTEIKARDEIITDLQQQLKNLRPFAEWVRMQGRHAAFCPAKLLSPPFYGITNVEKFDCTCGLDRLFVALKEIK